MIPPFEPYVVTPRYDHDRWGVVEVDTGRVVATSDSKEICESAAGRLNSGTGFSGFTPLFFGMIDLDRIEEHHYEPDDG